MNLDLTILVLLVPVVIGIVELLKLAGVQKRYAGLFSLAIGVAIMVAMGIDESWATRIVIGLAIGAAASGTYDYTKALADRIP